MNRSLLVAVVKVNSSIEQSNDLLFSSLLFIGLSIVTGSPCETLFLGQINNSDNKDNLSIFPNPAKTEISINFWQEQNSEVKLKVVNLLGESLMEFKSVFSTGWNNTQINTEHFTNGVYILTLDDGVSKKIEKFTISN